MAWTQAQLDSIEAAIATGQTRVEYTDPGGASKKVEFRSIADLYRLRDEMRRSLGVTSKPSRILGSMTKGL